MERGQLLLQRGTPEPLEHPVGLRLALPGEAFRNSTSLE